MSARTDWINPSQIQLHIVCPLHNGVVLSIQDQMHVSAVGQWCVVLPTKSCFMFECMLEETPELSVHRCVPDERKEDHVSLTEYICGDDRMRWHQYFSCDTMRDISRSRFECASCCHRGDGSRAIRYGPKGLDTIERADAIDCVCSAQTSKEVIKLQRSRVSRLGQRFLQTFMGIHRSSRYTTFRSIVLLRRYCPYITIVADNIASSIWKMLHNETNPFPTKTK